jgi:hypothetical protein
MSSIFVGITVLVLILELSAFTIMFWRSMNRAPYGRCPRFRRPIHMAADR